MWGSNWNSIRKACSRQRGDTMQHYCIFKGMNSLDLDLMMENCPPKVRAAPRYTNVVVPGRSGTLTQTDGTYDVFTRSAEFLVFDPQRWDEIMSMFSGDGELVFDDEPERKYSARIKDGFSFTQEAIQANRFSVPFECQPFARERFPQTIPFSGAGVLNNIGTYEAQPLIKVYGTGTITVTVNGKPFTVQGVTASAVIDCENMLAYEGQILLITSGTFPVLPIGRSTIGFSGASKLEITPNWRWL